MELEYILYIVGFIVSFVLGFAAKKFKYIDKHLIPIQNLAIGVIVCSIEYFITKDFYVALALSGLTAGGIYDIGKNINKLKDEE